MGLLWLAWLGLGHAHAAGLDITADTLTRTEDGTIVAKGSVVIEQRPFRRLERIALLPGQPLRVIVVVLNQAQPSRKQFRELRFAQHDGQWRIVGDQAIPEFPGLESADMPEQLRQQVLATVKEWNDSWNRRDLNAHLALYAADAHPDEFSDRQAWLAALEKAFKRPATRKLAADQVRYNPETRRMRAIGHVRIESADGRIEASRANIDGTTQLGSMEDATLYLPDGGRLHAKHVQRIAAHRFIADDIAFSQCPEDDEAWRVRAKRARLDDAHGILVAEDASFDWLGMTTLYTPYWRQAYKRQSGILLPDIGSSKRRGTELALPVYFAPSTNWDLTFTPRWLSARGLMLGGEWRHAAAFGASEIRMEGLNDTWTGTNRGRIGGEIQWQLPAGMQFQAGGEHVTDHDYLADFDRTGHAAERFLSTRAELSQILPRLEWSLMAQHQQDLTRPGNGHVAQILPRLETRFLQPLLPALEFHFDHQTTRFMRAQGSRGWRIDLHPYLESPIELANGGIRLLAHAGVRATHYRLTDTRQPNRRRYVHLSPEASIEGRMEFERIAQDGTFRHTIAPVLRYDWSRPPDQAGDPNFDSAFGRLEWSNLLSANRFSGIDRIERTSRVTLMVESRLQQKEGIGSRQVFMAGLGASYNILRRRIDPKLQRTRIRPVSNILGRMEWTPSKSLKLTAETQYNPYQRYVATSRLQASWEASIAKLSIGYRSTDARYAKPVSLVDMRGAVDLSSRWRLHASLQYDTRLQLTQQAALGIRYEHACWNVEVEGYRINRQSGTASRANTGFHILLGFKGLGSVGS